MANAGTTFEVSSEIINQHILPQTDTMEPKVELLSAEETPAWLNNLFVQNILQKHHCNDNLRVKYLRIQQCGGKGDSYASTMYRVGAFYFDSKSPEKMVTRSLIVKTLPAHEMAMEKLGSSNYNVQDKEMEMYQKFLPQFREILEAIGEDADIFPAMLLVDKKLDVIVLEDLAEKKFVMSDRLKCLDLDHISMSLKKLARMHAASAVIYEKDPEAFAHLDTGFFTRKTDVFHVMFESLCDGFIDEISKWKGYEYYAKKIVNIRKTMVKSAQKAFDHEEGDFLVLNHGDLWTNNLMFTYGPDGKPADCVLLDFQFASVGSAALDLIVRQTAMHLDLKLITFSSLSQYFLFTSTVDELRQERMEEMIQFYYYELRDVLKRLGYDMEKLPTLHAFQIQVYRKYIYGKKQTKFFQGILPNFLPRSFHFRHPDFRRDDVARQRR
jgi:Ecdysteroid kinase-like family